MRAWESFAAGWRVFWTNRAVAGIAAINFAVSFVILFLFGLLTATALIPSFAPLPEPGFPPVFRTINYTIPPPDFPFPGLNPSHLPPNFAGSLAGAASALIFAAVILFVISIAVAVFIAAATPGSLLAAIRGEFGPSTYFTQGRSYFWRSFGLGCFELGVAALLFFLLGLTGFTAHRVAGAPGIMVTVLLEFFVSVYAAGVLLVTKISYLTSRDAGLPAYFAHSAAIILKRYRSWLGLFLLLTVFYLLVMIFSLILLFIPFIGPFLISFVVYALLNITYLAVTFFAGLAGTPT
ncbi:MAG: hypothetical protein M0Z41_21110 [Peptococcaceae bacterium]|jgi:hypothetical protein|nr:hypothetical protein [Peptococcaceae bacterium]